MSEYPYGYHQNDVYHLPHRTPDSHYPASRHTPSVYLRQQQEALYQLHRSQALQPSPAQYGYQSELQLSAAGVPPYNSAVQNAYEHWTIANEGSAPQAVNQYMSQVPVYPGQDGPPPSSAPAMPAVLPPLSAYRRPTLPDYPPIPPGVIPPYSFGGHAPNARDEAAPKVGATRCCECSLSFVAGRPPHRSSWFQTGFAPITPLSIHVVTLLHIFLRLVKGGRERGPKASLLIWLRAETLRRAWFLPCGVYRLCEAVLGDACLAEILADGTLNLHTKRGELRGIFPNRLCRSRSTLDRRKMNRPCHFPRSRARGSITFYYPTSVLYQSYAAD